ncbi:MAG: peptidylprolyl isomerase, partial [Cyclobacteriaceae bacterium]
MQNANFYAVVLVFISLTACAQKSDHLVTIHTEFGEMKVILFDDTPLHKENFLKLAKSGRYDSTIFHRVMKEFMIQGGDVNAKEGSSPAKEDMISAEFDAGYIHRKGAVAAARQPDNVNPEKKSSENQFYIVQGKVYTEDELTLDEMKLNQYFGQLLNKPDHAALRDEIMELQKARDMAGLDAKVKACKELIEKEFNVSLTKEMAADQIAAYTTEGGAPHLDGEYTVFGQVISGMEVIDAIADQETGFANKPKKDIPMTIVVEEMKK